MESDNMYLKQLDKDHFDRVIGFEKNQKLVLEKTYSPSETIFKHHFDEMAVVPGAHLIQSCLFAFEMCVENDLFLNRTKFIEIKNSKFYRFLKPEQKVNICVEIKFEEKKTIKAEARIFGERDNSIYMKTVIELHKNIGQNR